MVLPDHQSTRVMKDEHGTRLLFSTSAGIRCRRMYTAMAILAATAYAFGVITSPLLSFLSCKQDALSSVTAIMPTALRQPSTDGNSHDQIAPNLFADLTRYQPECAEAVPSKHVRQTILDNLFNGTSPFEDFPPHHARDLLRQKRIKGWGSTGPVFQILLNEVKPRVVVELGTFLGASAIHMAILARELRLKTQILCVDDFRGWPGFRQKFHDIKMINGDVMLLYQFMQNVQYMNLTDSVVPLPFSTVSALRKMCEWGIYADLIEVDAAHDFNSAWADINAAFAILRPGGVIFGHDYFTKMDNRGVRRAVDLFAKIKGFRVQPHGQHWILRAA